MKYMTSQKSLTSLQHQAMNLSETPKRPGTLQVVMVQNNSNAKATCARHTIFLKIMLLMYIVPY